MSKLKIKEVAPGYFALSTGVIVGPLGELKPYIDRDGYPHISIRGKTSLVSRIIAKAFVKNPRNKPHVNHINAIKSDNNAENLEWVTPRENISHSWRMGLQRRGEAHHKAKLMDKDVVDIMQRIEEGQRLYKIAEHYRVTPQTISNIRCGRTRKYLTKDAA